MDIRRLSYCIGQINESKYIRRRFNITISLEDKKAYNKTLCCAITSDGNQCSRRAGYMGSSTFCGLHYYDEESTSRKTSKTTNILTGEDNFNHHKIYINSYSEIVTINNNNKTTLMINNSKYILHNLSGVIYEPLANNEYKRVCKFNDLKCKYVIV